MMDIKSKVVEIIDKVKNDKAFASKFSENPVQAVESAIGVNLPDNQINAIIDGVKSKLTKDSASSVFGKVKKLF